MAQTLRIVIFFSLISFCFTAAAQPQPGYYSGRFFCTDFENDSWSFTDKIEITAAGFPNHVFSEYYYNPLSFSPGAGEYKGSINFDFKSNNCSGSETYTLNSSGDYKSTSSALCSGGSQYSDLCSGKLTFTPEKENISFFGSKTERSTKCYNLKKPTRFEWYLNDTAGIFAQFKVVAIPCAGGQSKIMTNFFKYTDSAEKSGKFSLPKGKYKFYIKASDRYSLEGLPGVK
jgi:hypothetical protein